MVLFIAGQRQTTTASGSVMSTATLSDAIRQRSVDLSDAAVTHLLRRDAKAFYVGQSEFATLAADNTHFAHIGSDEATTCVIVFLRDPISGAVVCGHVDCEVEAFFHQAAQQLATHAEQQQRIDLYIVGGFDLRGRNVVAAEVLSVAKTIDIHLELQLACVGGLNTRMRGDTPFPKVYGVAMETRTGRVFPATFEEQGPAVALRRARFLGASHMVDIADATRPGAMVIRPFCYANRCAGKPCAKLAGYPDELMTRFSTSPEQEKEGYAEALRDTFRYIGEHPNCCADSFPNGELVYEMRPDGSWHKV